MEKHLYASVKVLNQSGKSHSKQNHTKTTMMQQSSINVPIQLFLDSNKTGRGNRKTPNQAKVVTLTEHETITKRKNWKETKD